MRLLLAEDEPSLSRAICAILRKNNYEADAVFNGEDAIDYLQSGQYDGALLDIMMPKKDGFEVLNAVRAAGNTVPILMLTARSEVCDKVFALDHGANDYLTKPFNYQELLARIRRMTQPICAQCATKITFGNVTLDRACFELTTPYGNCRLTNKEFQMIEMMMMYPGQLVATERFLEKIWGTESNADNHVVWIFISCLRKKLTGLNANIHIRVTRNVGYSLEEYP